MHPHTYIHVWRMCCSTSMIWNHLHVYALPRYQLLSPPDIQSLVNDNCMQHSSMEWIHPDTFADTHIFMCICEVCVVSHYDMTSLTLLFASISAPLSTRYLTIRKRPCIAAIINGVYPFWYIHTQIYACVTYVWFHINDRTSLTLPFASISAPFSARHSTTGKWSFIAAHINGVYPSWSIHRHIYSYLTYVWLHINDMTSLTLSFASTSAPFSTRYSTIGKLSFLAAQSNGVYPSW